VASSSGFTKTIRARSSSTRSPDIRVRDVHRRRYGLGKSFSSKQNFIRSIEQSKDRIGIILEPLNNWAGVAEAPRRQTHYCGRHARTEPLEIRETPEHVQRAMGEDASPFNEKLDDAMSFPRTSSPAASRLATAGRRSNSDSSGHTNGTTSLTTSRHTAIRARRFGI